MTTKTRTASRPGADRASQKASKAASMPEAREPIQADSQGDHRQADRGPRPLSLSIKTFLGKRIYPFEIHRDSIAFDDIAHALSNQCLYLGHAVDFYSAAQHSVLVSLHCDEEHALAGLLHHAAEAYVGTVAAPFLADNHCPTYVQVKKKVEELLADVYGYEYPLHPSVIEANAILEATEARDIVYEWHDAYHATEHVDVALLRKTIVPCSPSAAGRMFFTRFRHLTNNQQWKDGFKKRREQALCEQY